MFYEYYCVYKFAYKFGLFDLYDFSSYDTQLLPTAVTYFYTNIVFIVVNIFYILHSLWKQGTLRYEANTMQFEI